MASGPVTAGSPLHHVGPPPKSCDVVVVGGGIIGVMSGWFLQQRGLKAVVLEKGRVAGEQSSRNWGWIRQQGRDFAELPIMMESLRLWQGFSLRLPGLGFRQEGVMYLARTAAEMRGFEAWSEVAAGEYGLDVRLRSQGQVAEAMPQAGAPWVGGLWTSSDARAEPWVALPILAQAAAAEGLAVVENCAVRRLDVQGGKVAGVFTEQGRIACDQVVVAGGAWSSLFLAAHGVKIPQLSVLASVAATGPLPDVFAGNAADDRFAFRRREDGGYTLAPGAHHDFYIGPDAFRHFWPFVRMLKADFRKTSFRLRAPAGYPDAWGVDRVWGGDEVSPFEQVRVLEPAPNMKALTRVQDAFAAAFPQVGRPQIVKAWAGMIDTIPDVVPVIDRVQSLPGLVIATGMCGHGFGIGPGVGRVVADLVAGNKVGHDLSRFRLSRFSDGTRLVPGPSL
ncbi:FAD-binding oxidoreductase [Rhodobacter sp. KR11]|uniref:NAD(P)/FAD-dependent oxidoreductase n=1 Tax=Rhodobacter sp. KR11 TaxID=2974588 RepID=UPI002221E080|nr:FAD-binding oxidoreductase [Rhodobacter sp. KR11]MCW1917890.1 FAD-binding oxidoreductase [Rhodobacter sp. KR11]